MITSLNTFFAAHAITIALTFMAFNLFFWSYFKHTFPLSMEMNKTVYGKYYTLVNAITWGGVLAVCFFPVVCGWFGLFSAITIYPAIKLMMKSEQILQTQRDLSAAYYRQQILNELTA